MPYAVLRTYCFLSTFVFRLSRVPSSSSSSSSSYVLLREQLFRMQCENFRLQFNAFTYYAWMFGCFLVVVFIFLLFPRSLFYSINEETTIENTHHTLALCVTLSLSCFPWARLDCICWLARNEPNEKRRFLQLARMYVAVDVFCRKTWIFFGAKNCKSCFRGTLFTSFSPVIVICDAFVHK